MIHPCYVERVHTAQTTVPLAADMTTVRSLMAVSFGANLIISLLVTADRQNPD